MVEVHLEHPLLQSSVQMVVPPTGNLCNLREVINELFETTTPILLYGIAGDFVSEEVMQSVCNVKMRCLTLVSSIKYYLSFRT